MTVNPGQGRSCGRELIIGQRSGEESKGDGQYDRQDQKKRTGKTEQPGDQTIKGDVRRVGEKIRDAPVRAGLGYILYR